MADARIILMKLVSEPNNSFCADCGNPEPRWASWNLGVFLCMRCAAVHRKMGTHISKVKSLQLDHWTQEQLKTLTNIGSNVKSRNFYEALLPGSFLRPQSDDALEKFIRAKYEYKKFVKPVREAAAENHPVNTECEVTDGVTHEGNLIDLESDTTSTFQADFTHQTNALLLCFGDSSQESGCHPEPIGSVIAKGQLTAIDHTHSTSFPSSQKQNEPGYLTQVTQQIAAIKAQMQSEKIS